MSSSLVAALAAENTRLRDSLCAMIDASRAATQGWLAEAEAHRRAREELAELRRELACWHAGIEAMPEIVPEAKEGDLAPWGCDGTRATGP